MINANEIADLMGVSKATAYKIIRQLNTEFKENGCRTIQGRVSREYFERATRRPSGASKGSRTPSDGNAASS